MKTIDRSSVVNYRALIEPHRVHGSLYTYPDVFTDEMTRLFPHGWVFVDHDSEISKSGDWLSRNLGLEPAITVRGRSAAHSMAGPSRLSDRSTRYSAKADSRAT